MNYKNLPYPIKYAVEEITNLANDKKMPLGFIVTKVFVMRETRSYNQRGENIQFQIVYPVKGYKTFKASKDIRIPEFNQYGYCVNSEFSKYVYDNYEDAKKVCNNLNGNLFLKYYPNQSIIDRMKIFQDFEYEVMEATSVLNDVGNVVKKIK